MKNAMPWKEEGFFLPTSDPLEIPKKLPWPRDSAPEQEAWGILGVGLGVLLLCLLAFWFWGCPTPPSPPPPSLTL